MRKPLKFILPFLIPLAFFGCKKEHVNSDDLFGTWQYDHVQLLGVADDTTIALSGIFKFEASTGSVNAGGTIYGDFCKGRADVPIVQQSQVGVGPATLIKKTDDILFTKSNVPDNYNYSNFYYGSYAFEYNGFYYYYNIRMSMISKDEMNMQFFLTANSGPRYNIQKMTLRKI